MSRTRNLSEQGRELFSSALALTSNRKDERLNSPRALRRDRPSINTFQALEESDEDDVDSNDSEPAPSPRHANLSAQRLSPRYSSESSPHWKAVTSRRPLPKLELEAGKSAGIPVVMAPHAPSPRGAGADNDDMSSLWTMTTETKGKRETRRSMHGSKTNSFKAYKQRMESKAKRDDQRAADKARRGITSNDDSDYDMY